MLHRRSSWWKPNGGPTCSHVPTRVACRHLSSMDVFPIGHFPATAGHRGSGVRYYHGLTGSICGHRSMPIACSRSEPTPRGLLFPAHSKWPQRLQFRNPRETWSSPWSSMTRPSGLPEAPARRRKNHSWRSSPTSKRIPGITTLAHTTPSRALRHSGCSDQARGIAVRQTLRSRSASSPRVVLIDRMGILPELYGFAKIAFVGGSLRPFGGHNPLEPALCGTPVLFGPSMESQQEGAQWLLTAGYARRVRDADSLAEAVSQALHRPTSVTDREAMMAALRAHSTDVVANVVADILSRISANEAQARP
jgi:hypothetical protein